MDKTENPQIRVHLPFPVVTADPVGQPLPAAVWCSPFSRLPIIFCLRKLGSLAHATLCAVEHEATKRMSGQSSLEDDHVVPAPMPTCVSRIASA